VRHVPADGQALECGRTCEGVAIRVAQRILARAAAIWFNSKSGAPVTRSLIAFGH
jgi:hypothetical protein